MQYLPDVNRPPICVECFERWRLQGTGGCFTCPQCRRCIACGRSDCPVPILSEEARPFPLSKLLSKIFENDGSRPPQLHGLEGEQYRTLREYTRLKRVDLGHHDYAASGQDVSLTECQRQQYMALRDRAWQVCSELIMQFIVTGGHPMG
jgi:hypothetical protein